MGAASTSTFKARLNPMEAPTAGALRRRLRHSGLSVTEGSVGKERARQFKDQTTLNQRIMSCSSCDRMWQWYT